MEQQKKTNESRRSFVKKAVFIPPAIMTLSALPAIASSGSPRFKKDKVQSKGRFDSKGKDEFRKAIFDKKDNAKNFSSSKRNSSKGGKDSGGKSKGGKGGGGY